MKIGQIIEAIERFAPLSLQESWDNCGVQIGGVADEVRGIVLTLDVTPRTVAHAVATGSNLIISHHPLFFQGVKQITPDTAVGEIIYGAIRGGITIYSSHTASDSTRGGINDRLAKILGLTKVEPLEISATDPLCGMGRVGKLPEPMSAECFCDFLSDKLSIRTIPHSTDRGTKIERVALCGGSGSSLIEQAVRSGAEAYVCGDLKYHDFQVVDSKIMLFDVGHFASEICFVEIINSILEGELLKNSKNINTFVVHRVRENFISYHTSKYGH